MDLRFIGVGAGFSVGLGNNNAMIYYKDPDMGFYLIDCGETTRTRLVELQLVDSLRGVFVTHLHGDHVFGLEMLGFWWYFVKKSRLPIYVASESLARDLWALFKHTMAQVQDAEGKPVVAKVDDYFDIKVIGVEKPIEIFGKDVMFTHADHVPNKECYSVEIKTGVSKYLFTSDQRFCRDDVLLGRVKGEGDYTYIWHDCQLYEGGKGAVHASYDALKKRGPNHTLYLMHYNRVPTEEEMQHAKEWCGGFVEVDQVFHLD